MYEADEAKAQFRPLTFFAVSLVFKLIATLTVFRAFSIRDRVKSTTLYLYLQLKEDDRYLGAKLLIALNESSGSHVYNIY